MEIWSVAGYTCERMLEHDEELADEGELEPDEIEALEEERADALEMKRLTKDKKANYGMLRKLKPIASPNTVGAKNFMDLYSYFEYFEKIMRFQEWRPVEDGEIQVRVNPSDLATDDHGYAVVRPLDDPEHDLFLRVWLGNINSVIIMPRSNDPLPRQGPLKNRTLEQMKLIGGKNTKEYAIWLERMKKVK